MIGGLIGSAHVGHETHSNEVPFMIRGMSVIYFVTFVLDGLALTWVGMWFGLSSRKENEAVFKTILFVLVMPLACLFFWPIGPVLLVLIPIFWIAYASHRLTNDFRAVAVQRHSFRSQKQSWLPANSEYQDLAPAKP
jgi:predicted MFS family arabinose efflux permease